MMKKKGSPKRSFQITFRNVQEFQKDKKNILKYDLFFLPSHVSARDSKYHHGRNQFAAAVDCLKGLRSLIGKMF